MGRGDLKCLKNYGQGSGASRDIGTAKQLADRSGVKLSIVRTTLSQLRKAGKIKDTGIDAKKESVWEVVK